jgi:hypothetical protein
VVLKINQSCPQKKKSIMMTKIKQILIQDYGVLDVKFPGKNRSEQELKNIRTLIDFI